MSELTPEIELRRAKDAARAHTFVFGAEPAMPVKFIGHIEAEIETAFDSAMSDGDVKIEQSIKQAEHQFHERFELLVRARLEELKHSRPSEDKEVAMERFLISAEILREMLPDADIPLPLSMRAQTHAMLEGMEKHMRHNEQRWQEKLGRLSSAAEQKSGRWDGFSPKLETEGGETLEHVHLTPAEAQLDAGRRLAAMKELAHFSFIAQDGTWVDVLNHVVDIARSQLRMMGKREEAQLLSDQLNILDEDMIQFCRVTAADRGDADSFSAMGGSYESLIETVDGIRKQLPEASQEKVPSREQFLCAQQWFLGDVRKAVAKVHPRINPDSGTALGK